MNTAIIIVSFYTGEILFDCLNSVIASKPDEIILIDNGNDFETLEKLKSLNIKLITGHGNIGFGAACNLGAKNTNCENLLFLNPDAVIIDNAFEEIINSLRPKALIGGLIIDENGNELIGSRRGELSFQSFFNPQSFNLNTNELPKTLSEIPTISGAFFAIKSNDFKSINGFDEDYFLHVEDIDICKRFRNIGKVYINPNAKAKHIGSSSKAPKAFIEYHKFLGFVRYLWKFENRFLSIIFTPILAIVLIFRLFRFRF